MIKRDFYDVLCFESSDVPSELSGYLRPELVQALGSSVDSMFPKFAEAFPNAVSAISEYYSVPFAMFKRISRGWVYYLVSESDNLNLFYDLIPASVGIEGKFFDEDHSMLPQAWKELYRYFYSFTIVSDQIKPMSWINTPFSYGGRHSLERYRTLLGLKKSVVNEFEKALGSNRLYCWLLTDSGDALFFDEKRRDGKVYHVHNNDFGGVNVIDDPEIILDKYLAHFVRTGSSSGFDFRQ